MVDNYPSPAVEEKSVKKRKGFIKYIFALIKIK